MDMVTTSKTSAFPFERVSTANSKAIGQSVGGSISNALSSNVESSSISSSAPITQPHSSRPDRIDYFDDDLMEIIELPLHREYSCIATTKDMQSVIGPKSVEIRRRTIRRFYDSQCIAEQVKGYKKRGGNGKRGGAISWTEEELAEELRIRLKVTNSLNPAHGAQWLFESEDGLKVLVIHSKLHSKYSDDLFAVCLPNASGFRLVDLVTSEVLLEWLDIDLSATNPFIDPDVTRWIVDHCAQRFDTEQPKDVKLAYSYLIQLHRMTVFAGECKRHWIDGEEIKIMSHDLVHRATNEALYTVITRNDVESEQTRARTPWKVHSVDSTAAAIERQYGIHRDQLPRSPRRGLEEELQGVPTANVLRRDGVDRIVGVNVKNLKSKFNKRRQTLSMMEVHGCDLMAAIRAGLLDSNKMLVPDSVNKDYRSWIEWKQFVNVMISGRAHSIGVSLRYLPWTRHWALQCLEYDAGRIYEQHRLVCDLDAVSTEYKWAHSELSSQITTALNIVTTNNSTKTNQSAQCRAHHTQRRQRQQHLQGSSNMMSRPMSSFSALRSGRNVQSLSSRQRTMNRPVYEQSEAMKRRSGRR